jgi:uncharacterized protein (DUF486 family)
MTRAAALTRRGFRATLRAVCVRSRSQYKAGGRRQPAFMRTIILLTISNLFMTTAWYGHLKFKEVSLWKVVLISWGIAFVEYCFQVPANRIGSYTFSAAQLKTIQEVISLLVFSGFSVLYLKEQLKWNYIVGFVLILGAVFFVFKKW